MGLASHVPQLKINLSSLGMNTVHNFLPSGNLLIGTDLGSIAPSISLFRNGSRLSNDKTSRSTLFVIFCLKVVGNSACWIKRILGGSSSVFKKIDMNTKWQAESKMSA